MDLIDKIYLDMREAMKARDEQKVSVLRLLKSALKNAEIEKKDQLIETEAISVLEKQAKQRRDSIEGYKAGNRQELASKEEAELSLIETYLPEKLLDTDVEIIVSEVISDLGVTEVSGMGQVIKEVMARTNGSAAGKTVSDLVRKQLS